MKNYLNKSDKVSEDRSNDISASVILHSLPDAVFFTDSQMRIVYFNLAAEKITEFRSFEAHGMYCKDVLKSGICEAECIVKRALDSNKNIFNIETTITTATGKIIPALVSASIIKDREGKVVGYLYSFRDISLLKKIMSDLEISKTELAERNIELNMALKELQLKQEQLLQAQKMEALGTLAGGIAHDFNNILTAILGFASLAKSELSDRSNIYHYIEQIEQSAVRASELTSEILTFARRSFFELKTVDLNKVITDVLLILERTTNRNITIRNKLTSFPCYVEIDESKMEQALMNICVNAIEAMPEGGILMIETRIICLDPHTLKNFPQQCQQHEYVKLSVIDTGMGMDIETCKKIFDPFFTTKGKKGGTGLGLAMVYGLINEFNGHIEVESKIGCGTQVHCYLPFSKENEQEETYKEKEVSLEIPKGNGETILLVDDEKMILEMGSQILKYLGYNVLLAENGSTALEMYEKNQKEITLVILDLIMPKLSGKEVFDRLRQRDPQVKIIVSTGYAKEDLLQSLSNKRADGFLEKPYKIQEMAECIRGVLYTKS
jgi:PAS domain S-box-containing protein